MDHGENSAAFDFGAEEDEAKKLAEMITTEILGYQLREDLPYVLALELEDMANDGKIEDVESNLYIAIEMETTVMGKEYLYNQKVHRCRQNLLPSSCQARVGESNGDQIKPNAILSEFNDARPKNT